MKLAVTICCLLLLAPACSTTFKPKPEILSVRLGMTREEAHARLQTIGKLEKEEKRQQEVWRLTGDPSYTHLMVAYNKEYPSMRYVTAVANEQGRRVPYADVINLDGAHWRARRRTAPTRRRPLRATASRASSPKPSAPTPRI